MTEIILKAYHGGLGDNLQFSTLPEMFSELGYSVFIDSTSYFRNNEIFDLVWGCNPYIVGTKNGIWNAGDTPELIHKNITGDCISNWEKLHGFEPKNYFPKIYYRPKILQDLSNLVIIDLTSISTEYNMNSINDAILNIKQIYFNKNYFKKIIFKNKIAKFYYDYEFTDAICIENIFQYCDVLASCCGLISLHSGASVLSSAIKQDFNNKLCSVTVISKKQYEENKSKAIFIFSNINYYLI